MTSEITTPMEKYETVEHKHKEGVRCFIAHVEIDMNVFNTLSNEDKKATVLYTAGSLKQDLINHIYTEMNL
jgi:hypothetical protein